MVMVKKQEEEEVAPHPKSRPVRDEIGNESVVGHQSTTAKREKIIKKQIQHKKSAFFLIKK